MSRFAEIVNGKVVRVIVAEQDFIDKQSGTWIQTSYNTRKGKHLNGKTPLRKNFAGIGYEYSEKFDAFIPPKPYSSWVYDEEIGQYVAPVKKPDGNYVWIEETKKWKSIETIK